MSLSLSAWNELKDAIDEQIASVHRDLEDCKDHAVLLKSLAGYRKVQAIVQAKLNEFVEV